MKSESPCVSLYSILFISAIPALFMLVSSESRAGSATISATERIMLLRKSFILIFSGINITPAAPISRNMVNITETSLFVSDIPVI